MVSSQAEPALRGEEAGEREHHLAGDGREEVLRGHQHADAELAEASITSAATPASR
jgi:hypothetical protein